MYANRNWGEEMQFKRKEVHIEGAKAIQNQNRARGRLLFARKSVPISVPPQF
jgi:hypothetical protein